MRIFMAENSKVVWRRLSWVALFTFLGIVAGLYLGIRASKRTPLDLSYAPNWIVILDQDTVLDSIEGEVHAHVGVISRWSGEATEHTVLENKIEVAHDGKSVSFMWPDRTIYAAGKCEIVDVDGDGKKEFLLFDWTERFNAVRVVSYAHGQFQFRNRSDELISLDNTLEPTDLNRDGRLEFISERRFPENIDVKGTHIPVLMQWSRERGFEDVSSLFPSFYAERYLPMIREKMRQETDPQMRQVYSDAIAYVEKTLIRK
jgi:hypothetical protein